MTKNIITDRRSVLKASSSSLLLGGIGSVRGLQPKQYGTIKLVEAGIKYSVDGSSSCLRYHIDSPTEYWVDSQNDRTVLPKWASESTQQLIKSARNVVNAKRLTSKRAKLTQEGKTNELTTGFASQFRRSESILLEEPITEPDTLVKFVEGTPRLRVKNNEYRLPTGETKSVTLDAVKTTVRTRERSNEKAQIEGIPEYKLGYEVNYGATEVTLTPEVFVKNYGELEVIEGV